MAAQPIHGTVALVSTLLVAMGMVAIMAVAMGGVVTTVVMVVDFMVVGGEPAAAMGVAIASDS
jgi:hypothetical protein